MKTYSVGTESEGILKFELSSIKTSKYHMCNRGLSRVMLGVFHMLLDSLLPYFISATRPILFLHHSPWVKNQFCPTT